MSNLQRAREALALALAREDLAGAALMLRKTISEVLLEAVTTAHAVHFFIPVRAGKREHSPHCNAP